MFDMIAVRFNEGGVFMWVILIVFACACTIIFERLIFYYILCRGKGNKIISQIAKALNENDFQTAQKIVKGKNTPLIRLCASALEAYENNKKIDYIQENIERTAINELPRLSERLNYLSLFANIATLLGLLGTIAGLQLSFSSLATVEAAQKAAMLAKGIAQAMNTTAFGLMVAVPCMVAFTMLNNKQKTLIKDIDETLARLLQYFKTKLVVE